jgi:hypothetical protein
MTTSLIKTVIDVAAETCDYCDRAVVEQAPLNAGTASCAGLQCGHREVHSLWNEDCRQVVIKEILEA